MRGSAGLFYLSHIIHSLEHTISFVKLPVQYGEEKLWMAEKYLNIRNYLEMELVPPLLSLQHLKKSELRLYSMKLPSCDIFAPRVGPSARRNPLR